MKIAPTTTMIMAWSIAALVFTDISASQQKADPPDAVASSEHRNNFEGLVASPEHRHTHEGLIWPPQPRDSTNVVIRSNIEEEKKDHALQKARIDRLEAKAKTTPEAQRALGKQFTRITVMDGNGMRSVYAT